MAHFRTVAGLALALLLACASIPAPVVAHAQVRAMSFNIRYGTAPDGEHAWEHRRARTASVIRFHQPDIVGLQEALKSQLDELQEDLAAYTWIGVGRDDGKEAGEYSPIMYRPDRVHLEDWGTFWLSETPDVPGSIGWDAAITRIVTWAIFRDRESGTRFYHFNTHFDHVGQEARLESARLITQRIADRAEDLPVILTGDFNAGPESDPHAVLVSALDDARLAPQEPPHGPEGTMSGFVATREDRARIDYVFVTPGVEVLRFATLAEHWEGRHASDHFPVLADVVVP